MYKHTILGIKCTFCPPDWRGGGYIAYSANSIVVKGMTLFVAKISPELVSGFEPNLHGYNIGAGQRSD